MEFVEQLWASVATREIIILILGFVAGVLFLKWSINAKKQNIKTQLDGAQSHFTQDIYVLRRLVTRFEDRLSIMSRSLSEFEEEFSDFRKENEEIDNRQHVPQIIEVAKRDVSSLQNDELESEVI